MKKSALALIPLLAAAPLCSASALGSFGARAGYGLHFSDPEVKGAEEPTSFVGGAAWKLDVLVAAGEEQRGPLQRRRARALLDPHRAAVLLARPRRRP